MPNFCLRLHSTFVQRDSGRNDVPWPSDPPTPETQVNRTMEDTDCGVSGMLARSLLADGLHLPSTRGPKPESAYIRAFGLTVENNNECRHQGKHSEIQFLSFTIYTNSHTKCEVLSAVSVAHLRRAFVTDNIEACVLHRQECSPCVTSSSCVRTEDPPP